MLVMAFALINTPTGLFWGCFVANFDNIYKFIAINAIIEQISPQQK
jgi:hypothetical protein